VSQIFTRLKVVLLNQQDVFDSVIMQEGRRRKVLRENHPPIVKHSFVCRPLAVNSRIVKKEYRWSVVP
jgi:hypothetical protein